MYTVLSTLFCIAGWITALIVNVVWYKHCGKMNNEWYKRCLSINETWADLCMELIDEGADRIKGSKRLLKGKDEPQTEVYKCPKCGKDTPNEFDECVWCLSPKDESLTKCDLCKREGNDICLDCERKKQSGKE